MLPLSSHTRQKKLRWLDAFRFYRVVEVYETRYVSLAFLSQLHPNYLITLLKLRKNLELTIFEKCFHIYVFLCSTVQELCHFS